MPLHARAGRPGRGRRGFAGSHHPADTCREKSKVAGPEHILSSIKFSRCEPPPHGSRIPIRRAVSADVTFPLLNTSATLSGDKEVSSTLTVFKLLRPPGIHRHMTISGLPKKDGDGVQLASATLLVKNGDGSPNYKTETVTETDETGEQAEEGAVVPCQR